jgi:hypothetical protein
MRVARVWFGLCWLLGACSQSGPAIAVSNGPGEDVAISDDSGAGDIQVGSDSSTLDGSDAVDTSSADATIAPCNPGFKVDGQNAGWQNGAGCGEYVSTGSVTGLNGTCYAANPAVGAMQFFADWTWRTDADLCGAMFSRARFSSGGGKNHWVIKVFADKHNETTQNGLAYTGAHQAGYSFGASVKEAQAHPQFEWRIDAIGVGQVAILLHGPDKASNLPNDPGPPPGCTLPEKALVLEPTVLVAQMSTSGLTALAPAQGLIAVTVDKPQTAIGETVTVWGAFFGNAMGTAMVNDAPVTVVDWQPGAVKIQMPVMAAAEGKIVLTTADGKVSNPLYVAVKAPPSPTQCQGKDPGSPCDDGLSCTKNDTCKAGKCAGSDTCVGSSPCAAAMCSVGSDCVETPLAAGEPCKGGKCSGFCSATGICEVDSGVIVCDDKNPCTAEICVASGCAHSPIADTTACDDGDICTDNDACKATTCVGAPKDCNDNSACTIDQCDPAMGGCIYPTACDDGNPCTIDSCANGKCAVTTLADTTGCDDLNPCTTNTHCSGGQCIGTPVPGCK